MLIMVVALFVAVIVLDHDVLAYECERRGAIWCLGPCQDPEWVWWGDEAYARYRCCGGSSCYDYWVPLYNCC